jgi:hypothetical protein
MVENIQHDYFIWEEKNLTEPKTKLENNGVNEEVVSTNEIKNDLTQKDWKDITNPKERQKAYRKAYKKVYNEAYYEAKKDKIKLQSKAYRKVNKEKLKDYYKVYGESNKDKRRLQQKDWREVNKDRIKDYHKVYVESNKDKIRLQQKAYDKNRLKTNIQYKLCCNLRSRLYKAINRNFKAGSAVRDLGCTVEELKPYLESKFQPGMTWDNWTTDGWHIDHIKPLASFDLTDRNQLLEACHYTNLQPLWAKDNLIKSDKLI